MACEAFRLGQQMQQQRDCKESMSWLLWLLWLSGPAETFATWRPPCAGELFFPSLAASSPPKSSRRGPLLIQKCSSVLRVLSSQSYAVLF